MIYGQYNRFSNLNYKNSKAFTGNYVGSSKQFQDILDKARSKSVDKVKQNSQQKSLASAPLNKQEKEKQNPVEMLAYGTGGLAVSGGFGFLFKTTTWADKVSDAPWLKFFNKLNGNSFVKSVDGYFIKTGNWAKSLIPQAVKESNAVKALKEGLAAFKSPMGQLFEVHKDFLEKIRGVSSELSNNNLHIKKITLSLIDDSDVKELIKKQIMEKAAEVDPLLLNTKGNDEKLFNLFKNIFENNLSKEKVVDEVKNISVELSKKEGVHDLFLNIFKELKLETLSKEQIITKAQNIADVLKDMPLHDAGKGGIQGFFKRLGDSIGGVIGRKSEISLSELKGMSNRVNILKEISTKGPITKALSDTSMFVFKLFGGNIFGVLMNAVFMGQTIKAVSDAKPEDKHKVLLEELLSNIVGNWLLIVPIEKAFNAVMNFRNIGLNEKQLKEMARLENLIRNVKATERKAVMKEIKDLSVLAKNLAPHEKVFKFIGDVLSVGTRQGQPVRFITGAGRVILLYMGIGLALSEVLKKLAHSITGAPSEKETDKKEKKTDPEKKEIKEPTTNPSVPIINRVPVIASPAVINEPVDENDYVPSPYRDDGQKRLRPGSTYAIDSAMSKTNAVLKEAETLLKQY
ncbi:MAG: hypothetical protein WCK67_07335 [bacterium]